MGSVWSFIQNLPIIGQLIWFVEFCKDPSGKGKEFIQNQWRSLIIFIWFFIAFYLIHRFPMYDWTVMGTITTLLTWGISVVLLLSYCKMVESESINTSKALSLSISVAVIVLIYVICIFLTKFRLPVVGNFLLLLKMMPMFAAFIFGYIAATTYSVIENYASFCKGS